MFLCVNKSLGLEMIVIRAALINTFILTNVKGSLVMMNTEVTEKYNRSLHII